MPTIETYYLIDFENVKEDGLSCSAKLGSHDHVHIFSTENNPKISFKILSVFNTTELCSHIVPAGKQSLDMHLLSYLGYLIGKNGNNKCKYVIVSKDGDYDNIITFMKRTSSSSIVRQASICPPSKKDSTQTATAAQTNNSSCKDNTSVSAIKSQLNTKVQHAISNAGYVQPVINEVSSIVVKHYGKDKFANNVHNDLREIYSDYLEIYKIVKPIINQFC